MSHKFIHILNVKEEDHLGGKGRRQTLQLSPGFHALPNPWEEERKKGRKEICVSCFSGIGRSLHTSNKATEAETTSKAANKTWQTTVVALVPRNQENLAKYIHPFLSADRKDVVLEVECGSNEGLLYPSRMRQGSKGACILFQKTWLTPNQFQAVSGRESAKDWKRSITHRGRSVKLLMAKGILAQSPAYQCQTYSSMSSTLQCERVCIQRIKLLCFIMYAVLVAPKRSVIVDVVGIPVPPDESFPYSNLRLNESFSVTDYLNPLKSSVFCLTTGPYEQDPSILFSDWDLFIYRALWHGTVGESDRQPLEDEKKASVRVRWTTFQESASKRGEVHAPRELIVYPTPKHKEIRRYQSRHWNTNHCQFTVSKTAKLLRKWRNCRKRRIDLGRWHLTDGLTCLGRYHKGAKTKRCNSPCEVVPEICPTPHMSCKVVCQTGSWTGCGIRPASCPLGNGVPSPGIKRPGRETDLSPPSRTQVKNPWSFIFTPPPNIAIEVRKHSIARSDGADGIFTGKIPDERSDVDAKAVTEDMNIQHPGSKGFSRKQSPACVMFVHLVVIAASRSTLMTLEFKMLMVKAFIRHRQLTSADPDRFLSELLQKFIEVSEVLTASIIRAICPGGGGSKDLRKALAVAFTTSLDRDMRRNQLHIKFLVKAAKTSETLVNIDQTALSNNPEDRNLHTHRCENLKSYKVIEVEKIGIRRGEKKRSDQHERGQVAQTERRGPKTVDLKVEIAACSYGSTVRDARRVSQLKRCNKRLCADLGTMDLLTTDTVAEITGSGSGTEGDRKQRESRRLTTIIDQLKSSRTRGHGQPQLVIIIIMDVARTSETSANFYQTTRRNNPEDNHLQYLRSLLAELDCLLSPLRNRALSHALAVLFDPDTGRLPRPITILNLLLWEALWTETKMLRTVGDATQLQLEFRRKQQVEKFSHITPHQCSRIAILETQCVKECGSEQFVSSVGLREASSQHLTPALGVIHANPNCLHVKVCDLCHPTSRMRVSKESFVVSVCRWTLRPLPPGQSVHALLSVTLSAADNSVILLVGLKSTEVTRLILLAFVCPSIQPSSHPSIQAAAVLNSPSR
ncbi:Deformed epidermal autoregulatory factor 1-like protein [Zootermopsis nevadensis]|uniref:Deformed epidermal autoregulatory factor 1-like protein n=1 Tax=Zootermopsis nevadensis TaxID=136037 RepID=A0A067R9A1_ZOONE|nr:Deformed epidermal autoregulatory factor 1-like protein [Zootermopsis nevadensis]